MSGKNHIYAGVYDNAYSYYESYGNRAVFVPSDRTNGFIYCGTKGKSASTDTRYKTIGWKMTFYDFDGKVTQTIYFKLGGKYLKQISSKEVRGYKYALYRMDLSSLKSRLSTKTKTLLNEGKCKLVLDACMVVVKGSKVGGTMDDSGIKSGKVYTTYKGIAGAAAWNSAAKSALLSYFRKNVENLFFNITVKKDPGVKIAKGAGTYCYGFEVTLYGEALDGYDFRGWRNGTLYTGSTKKITVSKNETWTATAAPVSMIINYYRNYSDSDMEHKCKKYVYGVEKQKISDCIWKRKGYHFEGWSTGRNNGNVFRANQVLDSNWMNQNNDAINLYSRYSPNKYRIHFEGTLESEIPDMVVYYESSFVMPENGMFLGWSISPSHCAPDYSAGESVYINDIVETLGLTNTDGATIHIYAIWDLLPSLDASDLYYSLDNAQSGMITEDELASHARAYDALDGEIGYGFNEDNYFIIPVYYTYWFTKLTGDAGVPITYMVCNSLGQVVEKEITVHIVDTSKTEKIEKNFRIRFISDKYYKKDTGEYVDEKAGGLYKDSCWKKDISFKTLLQCALEP